MMGGGGNAGRVDYPQYMKDQHEAWVGEVDDYIQYLRGGASPYSGAFAYDPTEDITAIEDAYDTLDTVVDGLSPQTDWESNWDTADGKVDDILGTAGVTAAVTAFEAAGQADLMKAIARFSAGMQSHNAIIGNMAFPIGLALLNSEFEKSVDQFRENLSIGQETKRAEATLAATAQIEASYDRQLRAHQLNVGMRQAVSTTSIQANSDWFRLELGIDVEDELYDLNLYEHGHNMMGALAGSATMPRPTGIFQQVAGGLTNSIWSILQMVALAG